MRVDGAVTGGLQGIVKLTKSWLTDLQDIGLERILNAPYLALGRAVSLNLTMPLMLLPEAGDTDIYV